MIGEDEHNNKRGTDRCIGPVPVIQRVLVLGASGRSKERSVLRLRRQQVRFDKLVVGGLRGRQPQGRRQRHGTFAKQAEVMHVQPTILRITVVQLVLMRKRRTLDFTRIFMRMNLSPRHARRNDHDGKRDRHEPAETGRRGHHETSLP